MEGAFEAGAVVGVELADALVHKVNFGTRDFFLAQDDLAVNEARRGDAPQVEDDFEQIVVVIGFMDGRNDFFRENVEQGVEVVGDFQLSHWYFLYATSAAAYWVLFLQIFHIRQILVSPYGTFVALQAFQVNEVDQNAVYIGLDTRGEAGFELYTGSGCNHVNSIGRIT